MAEWRMDLAALDLNLLVALDVLLTEQNVTAAARRLHVSQPAASHALRRARDLFGDPLLVRRGNRLVRTTFAESLSEPLRSALAALDGVLANRLWFDPATDTRTIRIALTDYVGNLYLGPLIARVAAEAPGVSVHASLLDSRSFAGQLDRGELDLVASGLPRAAGVSREVLAREPYAVVGRRGHPVGERLDLDGWCGWPHVVMSLASPETPGVVDEVLAKLGRTRRVAVRVPSFTTGAAVVAASDLLMTLPTRLAEREAQAHDLVVWEPPVPVPTLPVVAGWATRRDHDPALVWLRDKLRAVVAA
jgi:DNA-binding transcriptional LysR family regulator